MINKLLSALKVKVIIFSVCIYYGNLCYSQTYLDDYSQFSPERRLVLSKMGKFFDETIRKNFPAEKDTLSYINFTVCLWQTVADGFPLVLNIDKTKLKEINQILFKDHNYYFFYTRVIDMWPTDPRGYVYPVDSIPTSREFGSNMGKVKRKKYKIQPNVNRNGYIKVRDEDNPVIKYVKEDFVSAGDFSMSSYYYEGIFHELSQQVKEYLAVIYWKYLCILAGVDLEERKPICETCDL